jgi:phosphoglycolate phosphatase-like HAD superfamily hydrolase
LGDIYVQTTNQLKSLELQLGKVNDLIKDPKNFIYEEISRLKRDVDLRKEKLKEEIDEICDEMIEKLDKYQQECYENIQSLKLEYKYSDALLKAQKYLDELTKDNNQLLIVSNDSKRKEIQSKAKELDIDLFARYENIKEELIMNKVLVYKESEKVAADFQKELYQFEE